MERFAQCKTNNNTIEFTGANTMNVVEFNGGSSDNIDIKNNLVINSNTGYNYYPNQLVHTEPGATISNLTVLNNSTTNLDAGSLINSLLSLLNPLINLKVLTNLPLPNRKPSHSLLYTRERKFVDRRWPQCWIYLPRIVPDIGANESGATANVSPAVSITSPTNNASFTTGSTVTINANATDADGTIAKVEFFREQPNWVKT